MKIYSLYEKEIAEWKRNISNIGYAGALSSDRSRASGL